MAGGTVKIRKDASLECVRCHEIRVFKAFHLNLKQGSPGKSCTELFAVEFNCEGNYFLEEFSQKFLRNHVLALVSTF